MPRVMSKWGMLALLLAIVLTVGCTTFPPRQSSPPPVEDIDADSGNEGSMMDAPIVDAPPPEPGLELAIDQRFSDIPLPLNLKPDPDRTYVFENRTLQIGRMVYTTRDSVNDLAQFFIRECPAADWELDSITQASGAELVFRKPGKRLAVTIRDLGVSRGRELIINMTPETE